MSTIVKETIEAMLAAVESRDVDRLVACFVPDGTWQNVPHPPALGLDAIRRLFDGIVPLCERIHWEVLSQSFAETTAWVERIDHFWIDGEQHSVRCNGVFEIDRDRALIRSVRDYVDLGEWRSRILPVYERATRRTSVEVVARHLDAVRVGDPLDMARDYATDAVLVRGSDSFAGRSAIADYFRTVPDRLGAAALHLGDPLPVAADAVEVAWRIVDDGIEIASGLDSYVMDGGRIVRQEVRLNDSDF